MMVSAKEWDWLVNDRWPDQMPIPTPQEAITGAKRLYRKIMGRPFPGDVVATSGRRYTWVRRGVMYVNPEQGWREIVHLLAHWCHRQKNPRCRPHHHKALDIEAAMTRYAIDHGFHLGKLKSKPREKKPAEPITAIRQKRLLARKAAWEAKRRRAETSLRKIERSLRYYEKRAT